MPRISKIRITGAKYDNFKKGYADSVFTLTRDDGPDHTLFTLVNQGGKGVFLQLVSQITMPGTRWGRESGNQLISMFYDRYRNFRPYTFHVIVEWKLDTVPEKWLITGICVTAEKRYTSGEQEERTGLTYFHYTIEHDNRGLFSVESLPVYNAQLREPVDYDTFERFVDEHARYIVKYPMSQTRRLNSPYYEYLKTRGIHRAEWEIMKIINKSEGGVSSYFSTATDNKSVIDKMLIPAITQNMSNYSENAGESLKEMFISNLAITRDLPRLLERENDYRELLVLLAPLLACAGEGYEMQKKLEIHILEGNNILATLENSMGKAADRKKSWEMQLNAAEAELLHYNFENDNLEYARYKRVQSEKKEILENVRSESSDLLQRISRNETNRKEIEADISLKKREMLARERQRYIDERAYLIESMGIEDLKKEIEKIESSIRDKWTPNKEYFEGISARHHSYRAALEQANRALDEEKRGHEKRLREADMELSLFKKRQEKHRKVFERLAEQFDRFSLAVPEYLLNEMKEEAEKRNAKIAALEADIRGTEDALRESEAEKYRKSVDLKRLKEDLDREEENFRQAQKAENALKNSICEAEGLDPVSMVYTHAWAKSRLRSLDVLINRERQQLDKLKIHKWEINADLEVNREEYWVPNSEILNLKQAIAALGIGPVQTGTEFLHGMGDEKTRNEAIQSEPLLPYGIVIPSEKEWELIERNIDTSLFLRAAVPVFVRKSAGGSGVRSVVNLGHRLATSTEEFKIWHGKLGIEAEALDRSIDAVERKLEQLTELKSDIHYLTGRPESNEIRKKANEIKSNMAAAKQEISMLETRIQKTLDMLKECRNGLEALKAEGVRENEKIHMLEAYIQEHNEIEAMRPDMDILAQTAQELQKNIDAVESEKNKNGKRLLDDEVSFAKWQARLDTRLEMLRAVIPDAFLDYGGKGEASLEPPDYDIEGIGGLFEDAAKRQALEGEIQAKNAQVKVLDERINGLNEKIRDLESTLDKTLKEWRERVPSEKSMPQLEDLLESVSGEIDRDRKRLDAVTTQSVKLEAELEQLEISLANVRKRLADRYGKQAQAWEGEDLQVKEYEIRRSIAACKKRIESFKIFIKDAEKEYSEISLSLSGLREYEELDIARGKVDESLTAKLEKEARKWVSLWQGSYKDFKRRLSDIENKMRSLLDTFRNDIKARIKEKILLEKLLAEIQSITIDNYKGNLDAFTSMHEHFLKELEATSADKYKAEQVREQWAQRAAKHVIRIIELIKEMVHGMVYVNQNGHAFPLIKLSGEELMPVREEDILVLLKEHFIASINKIIKENLQPEDVDQDMLEELMGDPALFSKALRGRYPVLMVYKMTEKNEFRFARPHDYYYASWEAINRGEEGSAEGSGGQKLSICAFMMMMLVNFKKRSIGSKNPWTVLMMDNPFGQASAKHILDPIFEIADSLNFQIIAFAPPEIIKIDISKRFPVFWELRIEETGGTGPDIVASRLIHGGRTVLQR